MNVVAISWYNLLHPRGYRPPASIRALAHTNLTRVIQSRFITQNVTANGQEGRFAETYNFVTPHFAVGSSSQEYITNTHSKYYPNTESKMLTILLGATNATLPFPTVPATSCTCSRTGFVNGTDTSDPVLAPGTARASSSAQDCCTQCGAYPGGRCKYFSFVTPDPLSSTPGGQCYLKATALNRSTGHPGVTFGTCSPVPTPPPQQRESPQITLVGDFHTAAPYAYGAGADIRDHGVNSSHLALHTGMVQHREALLMTSALDSDDALQWLLTASGNKYAALATNLLLPADAVEWLILLPNGTALAPKINVSTGRLALGTIELPLNSTVCLRLGGAALAVKPFELDGIGGQTPSLLFIADKAGHDLNAARLVGQHFASSNGMPAWINGSTNGRRARFAALAVAAVAARSVDLINLCERIHAAPTRSGVKSGSVWTAEANTTVQPLPGLLHHHHHSVLPHAQLPDVDVQLSIGRDLGCSAGGLRNQSVHTSWNCLTSRKIDGVEVVAGPWRVNGQSLAEIMAKN